MASRSESNEIRLTRVYDAPAGGNGIYDGASGELVQIRRADLDDSARRKRPECRACRYDRVCEGVWGNYLRRHGWDEFVPVAPEV